MTYRPNESHILNTFFSFFVLLQYQSFFIEPLNLANRKMHTVVLCHEPISCHGLSAAAEDVLNWTLGLDLKRYYHKESQNLSE